MLFAHSGPFELTVMLPELIPSLFNNVNMAQCIGLLIIVT